LHATKHALERRRARDQGTVAILQHSAVVWSGDKRGPDALLGSSQTLKRLFPHLVGDDGVEEKFPVASGANSLIGMQDPDHRHAQAAESGRQLVDRLDDASRRRTSAGPPGAQNVFCMSITTSAVRDGSSRSNRW